MNIDSLFNQPDTFKYPSDNVECFEDYFIRTFKPNGEPREFLPVAWTSFYRRAGYGKDEGLKRRLQKELLNMLDPGKKYFTVVTWDDGIMNQVDHLDLQIFAACGPRIDFAIPLLCQPHRYPVHVNERDILCSFVGSNNHPIRDRLIKELQSEPGFYISSKPHDMRRYCNILARSKYVLCPRGYGITSFRICEAIQYGAIPIYISNQLGFHECCIPLATYNTIGDETIRAVRAIVRQEIKPNEHGGEYTYDACRKLIIENISA